MDGAAAHYQIILQRAAAAADGGSNSRCAFVFPCVWVWVCVGEEGGQLRMRRLVRELLPTAPTLKTHNRWLAVTWPMRSCFWPSTPNRRATSLLLRNIASSCWTRQLPTRSALRSASACPDTHTHADRWVGRFFAGGSQSFAARDTLYSRIGRSTLRAAVGAPG